MDTPSCIRYRLFRFEQSVDDTSRYLLGRFDPPGSWHASTPYYEKCRIRELLDSFEGSERCRTSLEQDYSRIIKKLEELADKGGQKYRELLLVDLRNSVHAYHADICFAHLACDGRGVDSSVRRDLIDELFRELRPHYDLSALGALIARVDENVVKDDALPLPESCPAGTASERDLCGCCAGNSPGPCIKKKPSARQT